MDIMMESVYKLIGYDGVLFVGVFISAALIIVLIMKAKGGSSNHSSSNYWNKMIKTLKILIGVPLLAFLSLIIYIFIDVWFSYDSEINNEAIQKETGAWYDTLSTEQIEQAATKASWDDLMRESELYVDSAILMKGEVLQVIEEGRGHWHIRLAVKKGVFHGYSSEETVYLNYQGKRILEDDIIEVIGISAGLISYETVRGDETTIPEIDALKVTVITKAGDR
jgi:hypothetical protein